MKVNYIGYYFYNHKTDESAKMDLGPFLKCFCNIDAPNFKNSFRQDGEYFYVIPQGDAYLFLQTRSNEIIRKVDTVNVNIEDLNEMLDDNDKLGFTSYILLEKDYVGFASTLLAPKMDRFVSFINQILEKLEITDWAMKSKPLLNQVSRSEVITMPFIGKSSIVIDRSNNFFQELLSVMTADGDNHTELDGFEITFRPKSRQNIKPVIDKVLNKVEDEGIKRMVIKAKAELSSQLTDLYLVGQSVVYDIIDKTKETKIPSQLKEKSLNNIYLTKLLVEFRNDEKYSQMDDQYILSFSKPDTWSSFISSL